MSVTQQRTDLYAAVNGVSNIGLGYTYYRYQNEWNDFLALFKTTISSTPQIRGFMLEYRGVQENVNIQFNPGEHRNNIWYVHLFLGLSDANTTESTFATLIESVITAIKTSTALHTQTTYFFTAPAFTPIYEIRNFGDVLCHYAQMEVSITEFVA